MTRLEVAIAWRIDVAAGNLQDSYEGVSGFDRTYLGFKGSVSDKELGDICNKARESGIYIAHSMGELVPLKG